MTVANRRQLKNLVAKLKPAEKAKLADKLYASLPETYLDSVSQAWDREIDRRLDEYEAGNVKTIPSKEVHAGVRRRLNEIKARRVSSRRAA
jgi:putative addiction module component (TIGR02574 family)